MSRGPALSTRAPAAILAPVDTLTLDTLRALAGAQGFDLTDQELAGLLPLVRAGRVMMDALATVSLADVEPASQYRIL